MYNPTIEQDLRSVGYFLERMKCLFEFMVVVLSNSLDPCLDFLTADHVNKELCGYHQR